MPLLRKLEGNMSEQLLCQLWRNVLNEATSYNRLASASATKHVLPHGYLLYSVNFCFTLSCLAQVLVPPLRELEGYVFEQLLRQLWRNVLLEATFGDTLAGASAAKPILPSKHRQATREEQAVQRWLQALQVCTANTGSASPC